jgi:peptidyl-prolyl cis-trans isomerase SurA
MMRRPRKTSTIGLGALAVVSTVALSLLAAAPAEARVIERIIAVVNKEIILLSDLQERLAPVVPQLRRLPPGQRKARLVQLKQQFLDNMVAEKLIQAQARKLKIKVKDSELERAIQNVMRKNSLTRKQLAAALRREGKSIAAYKQQLLRPQLLRMKVLNLQVRPRVSVSEDEIKALYDKNLRTLGVETKVRARHIFIVLPARASAKQIAAKRAEAAALLALAKKKGADFGALAKKHSNDSVTRADGGDLGYFGKGTLPPGVEDVVFKMKKGEIRGPLRTERGFHVIQIVDRKESSARPFKEVRRQLKGQVFGKKMEAATKSWLAELRKRAYVDVRL